MTVRADRGSATRELIQATAERLFAERGVYAVSNRQLSEAAGQGNTAAVGYHFGAKTELVRAIANSHAGRIDQIRARMLAEIGDSGDPRDWVSCLVRPLTEHLAALGSPTWYARFCAQVAADPALHEIAIVEPRATPTVQALVDGLHRCLPDLPAAVRAERGIMVRNLVLSMCVEQERALADGTPTRWSTWDDVATGLVDALVGLWLAPVTPRLP